MKKQDVYKSVLILRNILICVFSFVLLSLLILSVKRLFLNIDVIDFGKYSLVLDEIHNSHLFITKDGLFIEGDRVILKALGALVECEVVTIEGELFAYFKDGNIDYYFNLVDNNVIGIVDSIVKDGGIFLDWYIINGGVVLFVAIVVILTMILTSNKNYILNFSRIHIYCSKYSLKNQ